jgi:glycerol-3-phosphate dehydrogenase
MAEDVLEIAARKAGLPEVECRTRQLPIHGYKETPDYEASLYYYGTDAGGIKALMDADRSLSELIHPRLNFTKAEIVWAVQQEMCMTIEDALSRRTRALLLDARAAMEAAPAVGAIMANELKKDDNWIKNQLDAFNSIAKNYLPV